MSVTNNLTTQVIPVENGQFRPPASFSLFGNAYVITAYPTGCALILTEARLASYKSQIDRRLRESPKDLILSALKRVVIGNYSPLESTENGCIKIPQLLTEHCRISDQLVWVTKGNGDRLGDVVLYSPALWAWEKQRIKN